MGQLHKDRVPVVDLFAGPGGLGEGFGAGRVAKFEVVLSVEAERWAHQTLTLRKFCLIAGPGRAGRSLLDSAKTSVSADDFLNLDEKAARLARARALRMTIGSSSHAELLARFDEQLGKRRDDWVLIGGPPCQAYSLVGRARNKGIAGYVPEDDDRHFLYQNYLRLIADRSPAVFVMENVKGIISSRIDGSRIFDRILDDLSDPVKASYTRRGGPKYRIACITPYGNAYADDDPRRYILRSELHGIPQARHRVILVGVRSDMKMPGTLRMSEAPSVRDAIGDLPRLRSYVSRSDVGMTCANWTSAIQGAVRDALKGHRGEVFTQVRQRLKALSSQQLVVVRGANMERGGSRFWNHSSRGHMLGDLARYFFAAVYAEKFGGSPKIGDFPESLWPEHANVRASGGSTVFADRFRVQVADRAATTITSHISKDGHYYIHYDPLQCRSLSVREVARIQTFPDDYIFCGPRTSQYVQVGNAVPPVLARQIANAVSRCF